MKHLIVTAVALLLFSSAASAQQYQEGVHYTTLDQATTSTGDVVVTEAFSYLCNHCKTFEPFIVNWNENKPAGVTFERIPVVFGRENTWGLYARAYVAAAVLGIADEAHEDMMNLIWVEQKAPRSLEGLAEFYSAYGVDADKFMATAESFAVDMRIRKEQQQVRDYGVTGTPTMIVNGKYRVNAGGAVGSFDQMLDVVDFLVQQELAAGTAQAQPAAETDLAVSE